MTIYTYQPKDLIDEINSRGHIFVDYTKTNLFRQSQIPGKNMETYREAYIWMARKLSEKTGVWMKGIYGDGLDLPKDSDGDYIDEDGQKLPVLPFWGWYITEPAEVLIDTITGGEKVYEGVSKMTVQELQKKLLNLQYEGLRWQQMCTLYPGISISFKPGYLIGLFLKTNQSF